MVAFFVEAESFTQSAQRSNGATKQTAFANLPLNCKHRKKIIAPKAFSR